MAFWRMFSKQLQWEHIFTHRHLCDITVPTSEPSRAVSHAGRHGGAGRGDAARQGALLVKCSLPVAPGA